MIVYRPSCANTALQGAHAEAIKPHFHYQRSQEPAIYGHGPVEGLGMNFASAILGYLSKKGKLKMASRLLTVSFCALAVIGVPDNLRGSDSATNAEPILKSIYAGLHTLYEFKTRDTKAIV